MSYQTMLQRLMLIVVTLLLFASIGAASAQETFSAGDIVLVIADHVPIHTSPAGPIGAEMLRGMRSRIVAVQEAQSQTWFYVEHNAYAWIPAAINGEPTLAPFTYEALEQIAVDATAALEANPNDVQAYVDRGTVNLAQHEYEEALDDYSAAIALTPDDYRLYDYRGKVYMDMGEYETSISDLEMVIENEAANSMTYNRMAINYHSLSDNVRAQEYYTRAVQQTPTYGLMTNNLGRVYDTQDIHDVALSYYAQALELDPLLCDAYTNIALVYQEVGDYESALDEFARGLAVDPYNSDVYAWRGNFYADIYGDLNSAFLDYNQAILFDPENYVAYSNRAIAYIQIGERDLAIEDLKRSIELSPNEEHAPYTLATLYGYLGRYREAIDSYNLADEVGDYYDGSIPLYRGQAYMALGEYEQALADLNEYLLWLDSSNPANVYFAATAHLIRGNVYAYVGTYDLAAQDYRDAYQLSPDFAAYYYSYGSGYRITPQREIMITEFRNQAANPDEAEVQRQLALIYLEFGYWGDAVNSFGAYRERSTTAPFGLNNLISALESLGVGAQAGVVK